ncbi:MAG TPA: ABC transporter permease, partial [Vicinamibacterales bacterium]|nr:ABC transporter permease [Vicinamibacterales bacterium]
MSIVMTFRIALKALNRNKMRTMLTMLGMIIGVAAVITMVALGNGASQSIEQQIASAGTNVIMVNAGNFTSGGVRMGAGASNTLMPEDAEAIRTQVPGVQYVAAGVDQGAQVVAGNQNWFSRVQGTDVELPMIRAWATESGAFFTPSDVSSAAKVCVIGTTVRDMLFPDGSDPVGQMIRIRNQPFKIVGVMASRGQSAMGQDQDDVIFAPYTTIQKKFRGITYIQ